MASLNLLVPKYIFPLLGGRADTSMHQDAARNTVGYTAYAVALFRAMETLRRDDTPQINDWPTVKVFSLLHGKVPMFGRVVLFLFRMQLFSDDFKITGLKKLIVLLVKIALLPETLFFRLIFFRLETVNALINSVTARTVFFDKIVTKFAERTEDVQIVTLGVGLDARPIRMTSLQKPNVELFEVDFPGILTTRKRIFDLKEGVVTQVPADLSMPNWTNLLSSSGFDPNKKTLWVIEGLTMYLTEEECSSMIKTLSKVSVKGSQCVVHWATSGRYIKNLFKFSCDDPNGYLKLFGWRMTDIAYFDVKRKYATEYKPEEFEQIFTAHELEVKM